MKPVLKFIGPLTLGYGLISCGESSVEFKDLNVDTKGNLYISIRDVNGTVLTAGDSVNVTLLQIDTKPRFADSLASMVCNTNISLASVDYIPIAADQTLAVDIIKLLQK